MNMLLILIWGFFSIGTTNADHPIHLSVLEFYEEKNSSDLGFSITFFMDDFGTAAGYDKHAHAINSGKMSVDDLIMDYLKQHLKIKVNGKKTKYQIREKESNFPAVTCYMELKIPAQQLSTLEIENTILLELFDDQKNMVHLRVEGKKQGSLILNHKKKNGLVEFQP